MNILRENLEILKINDAILGWNSCQEKLQDPQLLPEFFWIGEFIF